jgi:hypothetical protein
MFDRERIRALEQIMDIKINALEAVVAARALAQKEAVGKAEVATEKRFESVNEFRAQLNDSIAQFATKEALSAAIREQRITTDSQVSLINGIESRLANIEGRMIVYVGVGSTLATFLAGLFSWFGHTLH